MRDLQVIFCKCFFPKTYQHNMFKSIKYIFTRSFNALAHSVALTLLNPLNQCLSGGVWVHWRIKTFNVFGTF